jgi:hypothetical protein
MGFNSTAATTTLIAKLTPIGRSKLISTNNALITSFSFGDSDANYNVPLLLETGQVPADSGNVGANGSISNSTSTNPPIKSFLIANPSGSLIKSVEQQSTNIITEVKLNGQVTITGNAITQNVINRNDYTTDRLVNLFYSFGLPLNQGEDAIFTGTTFTNGGYSDTSFSGLAQSRILVFGINNTNYGELIDGKEIKLEIPTSSGTTYKIYSTFQNKNATLNTEDANYIETSAVSIKISNNIAFLFSDDIRRPNGDATLSWATGFGNTKPFSLSNKKLFNAQTNTNLGLSADTIVGIAYLDKGFLVITDQQIINDYDTVTATGTSITLNSISTAVFQNITCIAGRGEFGASTNPTFKSTDTPRISEILLYDNVGNVIAIAKTDRHVLKNINEFLAFNVKINL